MIYIELEQLIYLNTEVQLKILDIRNEESVRKWMYTDSIIGIDEHLSWIEKLKRDDINIEFVIMYNNSPVGTLSIASIDIQNRKANFGICLTQAYQGSGLGVIIEYAFINFYFDSLMFEKLNAEVIEGNSGVLNIHRGFFFKEEGFRRSNIIKNGKRIGIHYFGLIKDEWIGGRLEIQKKYSKIFTQYLIKFNSRNLDKIIITTPPPPNAQYNQRVKYRIELHDEIINKQTYSYPLGYAA
jgi:UDP-4-amino-4,6-dideoxy-N-acetyl-beta-L-altrosamine N-acetyltransferase